MSLLTRIIIMAVAWLILTVAAFYGCVKPECCTGGEVTEVVDPVAAPPPSADDYGIVSRLGSDDVLTGTQWPALRDRLVAEYRADPDQSLDVYGHYYGSEAKPADYENMGFLRAAEIKEIIVKETDIPADRINTFARLLSTATPAADEFWQAGQFSWKDAATGEDPPETEIIELENDEIIIRFPLDASTKEVDPAVDAYLAKLAQRVQQTSETISIVGHTDSQGSNEYNQALGQRRADFVKAVLVRQGVATGKVTTASRGETQPTATNDTEEGRRQNRRAEVKLTGQ